MAPRKCATILWIALALGLIAPLAAAEPAAKRSNACTDDYVPPEETRDVGALALRGVACFERGDFARALANYRRAYALARDPSLAAAIGRSLDELGLWSAARSYYELYLASDRSDAEGRARILRRRAALKGEIESKGVAIEVDTFPTGAEVWVETRGGWRERVGESPVSFVAEARPYSIVVESRGYRPRTVELSPSPGDREELFVELVDQRATFDIDTRQRRRTGATTALIAAPIALFGLGVAIFAENDTRAFGGATAIAAGVTAGVGGWIYRSARTRELELKQSLGARRRATPIALGWAWRF